MKDSDLLINLPKRTTGISRRFIYCVTGFVVAFIIVLVIIMAQTAPIQHERKKSDVAGQMNSEAIITKIQADDAKPIVISDESRARSPFETVQDKTYEAAANSQISIYQHEPTAGQKPKERVNHERIKSVTSKYTVSAGTIVPATLLTGINSDLPNQIIAKVRRAVYDSLTGNYLLIPQGATLIGVYDSRITYGQQRVLVAWSRILFPNGSSINLEDQPGADLVGMAGLSDKVNRHRFQLFSSAVMMSLFGAAGQMAQPREQSNGLTNSQIIYGAIGQQLSQTASQMIAKNMDVQPTITIRPGMAFNVLLTRDFVFHGPYRVDG